MLDLQTTWTYEHDLRTELVLMLGTYCTLCSFQEPPQLLKGNWKALPGPWPTILVSARHLVQREGRWYFPISPTALPAVLWGWLFLRPSAPPQHLAQQHNRTRHPPKDLPSSSRRRVFLEAAAPGHAMLSSLTSCILSPSSRREDKQLPYLTFLGLLTASVHALSHL